MNRRHFILIGSAGIAAVSIPSAYYFLKVPEYDETLAQPQSLSLIWESRDIKATGVQYRQMSPGEDSERSLVRLLKTEPWDGREGDASRAEEIVKKDFEKGNTVVIDGWILSRTEARQCALFSITESK